MEHSCDEGVDSAEGGGRVSGVLHGRRGVSCRGRDETVSTQPHLILFLSFSNRMCFFNQVFFQQQHFCINISFSLFYSPYYSMSQFSL